VTVSCSSCPCALPVPSANAFGVLLFMFSRVQFPLDSSLGKISPIPGAGGHRSGYSIDPLTRPGSQRKSVVSSRAVVRSIVFGWTHARSLLFCTGGFVYFTLWFAAWTVRL